MHGSGFGLSFYRVDGFAWIWPFYLIPCCWGPVAHLRGRWPGLRVESEAMSWSEIKCSLHMGIEPLTFTSFAWHSNTAIPNLNFISPQGVSTYLKRELWNSPNKINFSWLSFGH